MNTTTHADLGRLTGRVLHELRAVDRFLDDPITKSSGCGDELLPLVTRDVERRVRDAVLSSGFDRWETFVRAVIDRTSQRWAYDAGLLIVPLDPPDEDGFWSQSPDVAQSGALCTGLEDVVVPDDSDEACKSCGSGRLRQRVYTQPNGVYFVDVECIDCGYVDVDTEGGI